MTLIISAFLTRRLYRFSALHVKEMELRYMDESSAVLPSPDAGDYGDDSSGISATGIFELYNLFSSHLSCLHLC